MANGGFLRLFAERRSNFIWLKLTPADGLSAAYFAV
jgi:hypothetical protein